MSETKKYFWLRLKRDFFKRHDIQIIESFPDGKEFVLFYLKLLCESVDHEGNLRFSEDIPYTEEMLASITGTDKAIAEKAIKVLTDLKLMEVKEDGTFFLPKENEMIGFESNWAEKKRKQRELPKLTNGCVRLNNEMVRLPDGTTRYVDEKRYGGNGMLVLDRAGGKCEVCGSSENVVIHHMNNYSNDPQDLICLCKKCHGKAHSGKLVPLMSPTCPPDVRQEIEKEIEIEKDKDNTLCVVDEIIRYLNEKAGTKYRDSKDTVKLINGRTKEGFTVDDFKKVIDKKVNEWKGTDRAMYLRPSTLFAPSHFEEYLNAPDKGQYKPLQNSQLHHMMKADYDIEELERKLIKN